MELVARAPAQFRRSTEFPGAGFAGVRLVLVQYVLSIALLNLLIGFALAVFLRQRYQLMVNGCDRGSAAPPLGWLNALSPKVLFSQVLRVIHRSPRWAASENELPTPATTEANQLTQPFAEPTETGGDMPHEQVFPALGEPMETPTLSADQPEAKQEPQREKQPVELAIDRLRGCTEQHRNGLADLDEALRTAEAIEDHAELRTRLSSFGEQARGYLERRDQAWEELFALATMTPGAVEAAGQLRKALDAEQSQIQETQERFATIAEAEDLGQHQRQLRSEAAKMLRANDAVRDSVNQLHATVVVDAGGPEGGLPAGRTDPLTDLPDRQALEAKLGEFWAKGGSQRRLVVMMVDVDQMTRLNETYGYRVGNRLIAALGKLLRATAGNRAMVSRFSGQRFVLLVPEADLRYAVNLAEQIRQTVETTAFEYRGSPIHMTVSCGIAECLSDDSTATLYARGEATLHEAKRYGRNRSFVHDGKYPTPVVPPNLTLAEKSIAI